MRKQITSSRVNKVVNLIRTGFFLPIIFSLTDEAHYSFLFQAGTNEPYQNPIRNDESRQAERPKLDVLRDQSVNEI